MTDFTETRSMLKKLAMAHGSHTAVGRAAHNLLELTENYTRAQDRDHQLHIAANIARQKGHLNMLLDRLNVPEWHPDMDGADYPVGEH